MELKTLRTFISLAETGSFTRTAKSLNYTQAAITLQIHRLEEELQTQLFDRIGKTAQLTQNGESFYHYAVSILQLEQEARESLQPGEELVGKLRIGTIDSLSDSIVPELLQSFHFKHPKVCMTVMVNTPEVLLEMLNRNDLDLVYLMDERRTESHLVREVEKEEEIVFCASPNAEITQYESVSAEKLSEFPCILTEEDASYRKILERVLDQKKIKLNPYLQSGNTNLVVKMTENGDGFSFLPRILIQKSLEEGRLKNIEVPEIKVFVVHQLLRRDNKHVTREMKEFSKSLREKLHIQ